MKNWKYVIIDKIIKNNTQVYSNINIIIKKNVKEDIR